jgi:2Fe-2S ferredoxin
MVKVVYIDAEGAEQSVEAKVGQSVMEAAVKNGVTGIVGECGGQCACGTCKVFVDPAWRSLSASPPRSSRR